MERHNIFTPNFSCLFNTLFCVCVLNKQGKVGVKILWRYTDMAIFVLRCFFLTHPVVHTVVRRGGSTRGPLPLSEGKIFFNVHHLLNEKYLEPIINLHLYWHPIKKIFSSLLSDYARTHAVCDSDTATPHYEILDSPQVRALQISVISPRKISDPILKIWINIEHVAKFGEDPPSDFRD